MKILLYIALHQRRELEHLYYPALQRFCDYAGMKGIEIYNIFIFSEWKDYEIAKKYFPDAYYEEALNYPLGAKFNAGLYAALKLRWDYWMQLGCDDILLPEYWDAVYDYLLNGKDIIGMNELFFYDIENNQAKHLEGTHMIFGAGRFIRRELIEQGSERMVVECLHTSTGGDRRGMLKSIPSWKFKDIQYKVIEKTLELWTPDKNSALDASSFMHIMDGYKNSGLISQVTIDYPYIVDIKTSDNINTFDKVPGRMLTAEETKQMKQAFRL